MNKKVYILCILMFSIQYLSAQISKEPVFGIISQEEIDMEYCSFDSTATAIVLFDIGKSRFVETDEGFVIQFTKHKRIKILKKQGIENGEVSIQFHVDEKSIEEKITSIEAYTYIVEGGKIQKHELDPTTVYTERINQWWKQKKFVFPNLKEGAIIEYLYILETPFVFNLPDWEFQSRIPTLYSQYQVNIIPFYEYAILSQRIDSFDFQESVESKKFHSFGGVVYKELIYTMAMNNIKAFKDEAYITTINDYLMKVDFQLSKVNSLDGTSRDIITTWPKLNSELLANKHFGKYINGCKRFAKEVLKELDIANQNQEQKIATLVKYVKESFFWNGYFGKYTSQTPKEFFKRKAGNVAEINLFLLSLLREAGISADPIILSTRDHGKLSLAYPNSKAFNYVLVYIYDGEYSFLTDGTNPLTNYLMIPTFCINDYGLVVNKDKVGVWAQIQYSKASLNKKSFDIHINPETKVCEVSATVETNFFEGLQYRTVFKNDTLAIKNDFGKNFDVVFGIETKNYNEPDLPYIISFNAEKELSYINDYLIIEPFFGFPPVENNLKQEKRDYPVDMVYPKQYQYEINIYLPNGYTVDRIPEPYHLNNDLVSISFSCGMDNQNNRLNISGEYKFKKAVYSPENYYLLKSNIDYIVDKFNIEVVLEAENK